jgi:hypothetical protein
MPVRPRLDYDSTRQLNPWRCIGPRATFPWAYGKTPEEAYRAWKKMQKRPLPSPAHAPTMDEHATNLGAAT